MTVPTPEQAEKHCKCGDLGRHHDEDGDCDYCSNCEGFEEDVNYPSEAEQKEAFAKIREKTEQAMALIRECEQIAIAAKVEFSVNIAWGMGGHFNPHRGRHDDGPGWDPSSSSC